MYGLYNEASKALANILHNPDVIRVSGEVARELNDPSQDLSPVVDKIMHMFTTDFMQKVTEPVYEPSINQKVRDLVNAVAQHMDVYNTDIIPLAYIDGNDVQVFENLSHTSAFIVAEAKYPQCDALGWLEVYNRYETELVDPVLSTTKWATFDRGLASFLKPRKMSIDQYLRKYYVDAKEKPDDQIRDIADKIRDTFKPVEIEFTSDKDKILEAYLTGPKTCMALSDEHCRSYEAEFRAKTFHPAYLYAGIEGLKLAIMLRGSTCVGRTIVYESADGTTKGLAGKVYANTTQLKDQFTRALGEQGYSRQSDSTEQSTIREIYKNVHKVPCGFSDEKGDYLIPAPYRDNYLSMDLFYFFDVNERCAYVSSSKAALNKQIAKVYPASVVGKVKVLSLTSSTTGYLAAKSYVAACAGTGVLSADGYLMTELGSHVAVTSDGHTIYNGNSNQHGYYRARDASGSYRWVREFVGNTTHGVLFTTWDAAERNGYAPIMGIIGDTTKYSGMAFARKEGDGYTSLVCDGEFFLIPYAIADRLKAPNTTGFLLRKTTGDDAKLAPFELVRHDVAVDELKVDW